MLLVSWFIKLDQDDQVRCYNADELKVHVRTRIINNVA